MARIELDGARTRRWAARPGAGFFVGDGWFGPGPLGRMQAAVPQETVRDVVQAVIDALYALLDGSAGGTDRRALIHRRQIAMYVMHVVLCWPMTEIGRAFGRDRTTVGHACRAVEDRRDEAAYDRLVTIVENLVATLFAAGDRRHGWC